MTTEKKHENMKMLIIILLILNVLLGIYIAFIKHDALRLETLKVGGAENMSMAKQLYESPAYIQQQKSTLDQILGSMNTPTTTTPTTTDTVTPTDTTTTPVVTQ